ncbi:hypothetical protein NQ314_015217 [Rhamnusium bicolor]|uniref:MnmE helical domain-containing protein n=1 Tax=Rhamnusium bicolor TaxID=1586634 RepID=A0AAV8WZZ2_9CUCU|nr:hypothetical protein NQ314_015217 [Rhamnusium bicolor]
MSVPFAFLQTQGSLSKVYNNWKKRLIKCVAHIEAHIDFEETDTLEHGLIEIVKKDVKDLSNEIEKHLSDGRKGEILRNGVKTIILGEPNAGKSSLLNILCLYILNYFPVCTIYCFQMICIDIMMSNN